MASKKERGATSKAPFTYRQLQGMVVALLEIIEKGSDAPLLKGKDAPPAIKDARVVRALAMESGNRGAIDYAKWADAWNSGRGLLPALTHMNTRREASIRALVDEYGGDEPQALEAFRLAVAEVSADPWWQGQNSGGKRYGFDNLMVAGRVTQKAEAHSSAKLASVPDSGATGSPPPDSSVYFKKGDDVMVLGWMPGTVEKVEWSKHGLGVMYHVRMYEARKGSGDREYASSTTLWRADELESVDHSDE